VEHALRDPLWPLADAEGLLRLSARIDLDHLGSRDHECAVMGEPSQATRERRDELRRADPCDDLACAHGIANSPIGEK
jgi:hypothetical protein